jgi:DNA invertase Pin-like site-specific DNA recombinase
MIYLYALVSTDGQRADARLRQLRTANCERFFREVASEAVGPIPVGRSIALGCFQFLRNRVVFRLAGPRLSRV